MAKLCGAVFGNGSVTVATSSSFCRNIMGAVVKVAPWTPGTSPASWSVLFPLLLDLGVLL